MGFDTVVDRHGTWSSKWDVKEGELPLSTADMDFRCAEEIIDALRERVDHGIFGYTDVADKWKESIIAFFSRRHHFIFDKDEVLFSTGVIPTISSTVRKLTTPAEKIVVLTPVYNIFFNSIVNNGRVPLESPLIETEDGYDIDFKDLEAKLADPQTTMMIMCNPHNPVGRIWTKDELAKVAELAYKHHVIVLSDEIHCDLVDPGKGYMPFSMVSDIARKISVTCIAASKAFNLAGLQGSAIVIYDEALRNKVNRAINTDEVAEPNAFVMSANIAAFDKGERWLDDLRSYVYDNKIHVENYIREHIPDINVKHPDATYLLWLDISALGVDSTVLAKYIREKTGLILSDGSIYHGQDHLRMNLAYPRVIIDDALSRLEKAIRSFKEER